MPKKTYLDYECVGDYPNGDICYEKHYKTKKEARQDPGGGWTYWIWQRVCDDYECQHCIKRKLMFCKSWGTIEYDIIGKGEGQDNENI